MSPQKRNGNRFVKIFAFAAVLFFVALFAIKFLHLSPFVLSGPKSVVQFLTTTGLKSDNNRTNILLLGVGGEGHDGPYLTDTMMIASIDKDGKGVALISIPRDIWVPDQKEKINAVYPKNNNNLKITEQIVTGLLGLPIHYGVRIDFSGFERAVDLVGGLDINVDNSFTDARYPINGKENDTCGIQFETKLENGVENVYFKDATGSATLLIPEENDPFTCRYETLKFQKGQAHMDGKTALKYIRSRHGDNNEGSDFARSTRQEKVILAFRQKVLSASTLLNPKKILNLINTFGGSVDTDIGSSEIPFFLELFPKVGQNAIRKIALDADNVNSRLEVGDFSIYGGYVLLPKGGSWQDLAAYIKGEIEKIATPSATPAAKN
ncbi:MAG: LCP family protein [Candidatus Curtissbacteria bacterium]|nr:LCP family protein [Candidatus Curtissbacteria bacterium]